MESYLFEKQIIDNLIKINIHATKITSFDNSSSRSIYKIDTKKESLVVKIFDPSYYDGLQKEIVLLQKIAPHYNHIILPMHHSPIMMGENPAYIYKFFNGRRFSDVIINNKYFIFGKIIAELDITLQKLSTDFNSVSTNVFFNLSRPAYANINLNQFTANAIKLFDKKVLTINPEKIRKQYIHKDLHFFNVIYNTKNREYLIIDTSGLSIQCLPREIAVSVGNILIDSLNRFSKKNVKNLMVGYNALIKLDAYERKAIPLFIIQKKLGEIDYLYQQLSLPGHNISTIKKYLALSQQTLKYIVNNYDGLVDFFSKTD